MVIADVHAMPIEDQLVPLWFRQSQSVHGHVRVALQNRSSGQRQRLSCSHKVIYDEDRIGIHRSGTVVGLIHQQGTKLRIQSSSPRGQMGFLL